MGTWNPRQFQSLSFNISKDVPNNIFEDITIYTTGRDFTFNKETARVVGTLSDITGNSLTISGDPSNAATYLEDGTNYY